MIAKRKQQGRTITKLSRRKARKFLLKQDSYCSVSLPDYFQFNNLLQDTSKALRGKQIQLSKRPKMDYAFELLYTFHL